VKSKIFEGEELRKIDYLKVEELYVKSVLMIVAYFDSDKYVLTCISKDDEPVFEDDISCEMIEFYHQLENGTYSETLSPEIEFLDEFKIEFGYDYYMYLYTECEHESLAEKIRNIGLFVS